MTSISRPHPRRGLPWEVLLLVIEESDVATLAALGRVSLDFLAATTKALYEDVEVRSLRMLEMLFCERAGKTQTTSRINHLLSLSQIKNLRITIPHEHDRLDVRYLSFSRLVGSYSLPLHLLQLTISAVSLSGLHTQLLPNLNPTRLEYATTDFGRVTAWFPLKDVPRLPHWNRLEVVVLSGVIPWSQTGRFKEELAGLPAPSLGQRRTLRLNVASLLTQCDPNVNQLLLHMQRGFSREIFGFEKMQEGSIVLVVKSREEEKGAKEVVARQEERFRSVYSVELEV